MVLQITVSRRQEQPPELLDRSAEWLLNTEAVGAVRQVGLDELQGFDRHPTWP
jgi:hypothetical protein